MFTQNIQNTKLTEILKRYKLLVRVNIKLLHRLSYRSCGCLRTINAHIYSRESQWEKALFKILDETLYGSPDIRALLNDAPKRMLNDRNLFRRKKSFVERSSVPHLDLLAPRSAVFRASFPTRLLSINHAVLCRSRFLWNLQRRNQPFAK